MSAAPRPLAPVEALQARRAIDARVLASEPTVAVLRVWAVVANYTLGYGRTSDALTHGRIAAEAGVGRESVRRALRHLVSAGVIAYKHGYGDPARGRSAFSQVRVLLPAKVTQDTPPVSGDPSSEWGGGPPASGDGAFQPVGTPPLQPVGRVPSSEWGNRRRTNEEDATEEDNRGRTPASVVTSASATPREDTPAPATIGADLLPAAGPGLALVKGGQHQRMSAEEIVESLASACHESGHPLTRSTLALLPAIKQALASGYNTDAVFLGLGFWRAEGYCSPRQIGEMTERAILRGGQPGTALSPAELLAEGARRYAARRPPQQTAADARQAATLAVIANWRRPDEGAAR